MKPHLLALFFCLSFTLPSKAETYVTETGVQIDRCACAWFILRFLDPEAQFLFFKHGTKPPAGIGFDYFGAPYFHKGPDCSFTSFIKRHPRTNQRDQKALQGINQLVNDVFAWRDGPKSAPSLFRLAIDEQFKRLQDDQKTLNAALPVFDYIYLTYGGKSLHADAESHFEAFLTEQQLDFHKERFTRKKDSPLPPESALVTFLNTITTKPLNE